MDIAFEIILSEEDVKNSFDFQQQYYVWDEVAYPQDNFRCEFYLFQLALRDIPSPYIIKGLPDIFKEKKIQCVSITGEGLWAVSNELYYEKWDRNEFDEKVEYRSKQLYDLLNRLLSNATIWAVIFVPQYDNPITEITQGSIDNTFERIKKALIREEIDGFIMYNK